MWKLKFGFVLRFQDPPNGLNIAKVWEENFALAKIGEELGFDACFTAQHHFIPDGYNPSPLVTLAAIGAKTSRLKLGAAIFQLPLYHPLQVAEDAAMLDVVSGGRLILGVGLSAVEREFKAFGHDIRQQGSMMDEGIEIILRAWTEDGFSFHGRHYKMSNVTLRPKPLQKPHPPVWVGGMSKGGVSRAARFGLPWVTAP
ncbi:MAG: LLM class flavin-dependent oxidoreductase, partial [Candidatus Bathyarchaeia archaeon]